MIWEATAIHTAYPKYLNSQLRTQIFQMGQNPFLSPIFKRIETPDMRETVPRYGTLHRTFDRWYDERRLC